VGQRGNGGGSRGHKITEGEAARWVVSVKGDLLERWSWCGTRSAGDGQPESVVVIDVGKVTAL